MIDYTFMPYPDHLFFCLDEHCRNVLGVLISLSNYYVNKHQDTDGWFFRTNALLESATKLSRRVLNGALDALYQKGIIGIVPQSKGKGSHQEGRKYKVFQDSFKKYEDIPFEECDCFHPEYGICTLDYKHGAPSFQKPVAQKETQDATPTETQHATLGATQSRNNIDIIDNKEIKKNINYIDNKEYNIKNNNYLEQFVPDFGFGVSEEEDWDTGPGELYYQDNPEYSQLGGENESEYPTNVYLIKELDNGEMILEKEEGNDSDRNTLSNDYPTPAADEETTKQYYSNVSEKAEQEPYHSNDDGEPESRGGVDDGGIAAAAPRSQEETRAIRRDIDKKIQLILAWAGGEITLKEMDENALYGKAMELWEQLEPGYDKSYYAEKVAGRAEEMDDTLKARGIKAMELRLV